MKRPESESAGRILVVEDEELLLWSMVNFLRTRGHDVDASADGPRALEMVRSGAFDVVVTDLHLRESDGLCIASTSKLSNPQSQVVIVTGLGSKESVIAAMRQGVWDYIEKPFDLELLLITVEKALDKSRTEKELLRLSRTDGLTGLFNLRHFYAVLEDEMGRAERQNRPISLILIDVDDFKGYNDRLGHLGGDEALVRIASCITAACRRNVDKAFRYGGDEFVVVLPEAGRTTARSVARRISRLTKEEGLGLTLSLGVTELPRKKDLRDAVREADEAMYLAKQFGGDRTVTF